MKSPHLLTFLKAWIKNPKAMGSVTPSSAFLAKKMANKAHLSDTGIIVELGPGTGAITKQLIKNNIAPEKIHLIELDDALAKQLTTDFPNTHIIHDSATNLTSIFKDNSKPVDTIISSLPLLSLEPGIREAILQQVPQVLAPNGLFIQFTYNLLQSSNFYPSNFQLLDSFIVWRNIPPSKILIFKVIGQRTAKI